MEFPYPDLDKTLREKIKTLKWQWVTGIIECHSIKRTDL